jgi:carbonic anhydrase
MNISPQSMAGSCTSKCMFSFNYSESNGVTAQNNGQNIQLTIQSNSTTPPVLYNNVKYNLVNSQLRFPSSHLYNGSQASGELLLIHQPVAGGSYLIVSIPINTTGAASKATTIVNNIIDAISTGANTSGHSTNKIPDFNYNNVVPMAPFYSYTDEYNYTWVCYGIKNAITIDTSHLQTIKKCIKPNTDTFKSGPSLFLNSEGPSNNAGVGGDIYIDCQPTGNSEEEENVQMNKTASISSGVPDYVFFFVLIFIISTIVFFVIIMGSNKLLTFASAGM